MAGVPLWSAAVLPEPFLGGCDDPGMDVSAGDLGRLLREAVAAHGRMCGSAGRMTESECRGPSLLPGWSRGHVLTHWALMLTVSHGCWRRRCAARRPRNTRGAMRSATARSRPERPVPRG